MNFLRGNSMQGSSARQASASEGNGRDTGGAVSPASTEGWVVRTGESGQTTVAMAAMIATFLFGFVGFAIDVQSLFQTRRQLQVVADAAATAAAEESPTPVSSTVTTSQQAAANAIAKLNGFDPAATTNPTVVTINPVPTSGNYSTGTAPAGTYLEVIVSKPVPTFFSGVITHHLTMTVKARAVAAAGQSAPACICLEGTSGTDLNLSNNAKLTPTGCGTYVDSSSSNAVTIVGGSTLGGTEIGSVSSNWDTSSNVNNGGSIASGTKVVQGLTSTCSPPNPPAPSYNSAQCTADPLTHYGNGGSSYNVGPGSTYSTTQTGSVVCYNSLTVGANGDAVNLNAGTYVISNGQLHFESGANNASNTGGNGVFFYLTGTASLVIDNGANVNLTAMSSGSYSGILVYQDPGDSTVPRAADTQAISIQGGSNVSFNGAIFAPTSNVTLGNGSGTSITADIVAQTLTMNGGGTLSSTAANNFGSLNSSVAKIIE